MSDEDMKVGLTPPSAERRDQHLLWKVRKDSEPAAPGDAPGDAAPLTLTKVIHAAGVVEFYSNDPDPAKDEFNKGAQWALRLFRRALAGEVLEMHECGTSEAQRLLDIERERLRATYADHDPEAFTQRLVDRIGAEDAQQDEPPTRMWKDGPMR